MAHTTKTLSQIFDQAETPANIDSITKPDYPINDYQVLFDYMAIEYGLVMSITEMDDLINCIPAKLLRLRLK